MKKDKQNKKTSNSKNRIQKTFYVYLVFALILAIFSFIYAILIYTGKFSSSSKSFHTITFFIGVFSFFFLGMVASIVAKKNGLLEGFIAALIIILIVLLVNLVVKVEMNGKIFIKGFIYVLSSSLGGVIGINLVPKKSE